MKECRKWRSAGSGGVDRVKECREWMRGLGRGLVLDSPEIAFGVIKRY